jgi:hypothetical protein
MILYLPLVIQGGLMVVDEGLHQRRGLGRWERIGHPLDTLTVILTLFILLRSDPGILNMSFLGAAFFSCLFITKDEWVHQRECSGFEQWLHALLFIMHPLIFTSAFFLWQQGDPVVPVLLGVTVFFFFYQILRWGPWWKPRK